MLRLRKLLIPALVLAVALVPVRAAQAAPPPSASPGDARDGAPEGPTPRALPNIRAGMGGVFPYGFSPLLKTPEGSLMVAVVHVRNEGLGPANASRGLVEVRIDGALAHVHEFWLFPLAGGQNTGIGFIVPPTTPGQLRRHEVKVTFDFDNQLVETSETDNTVVLTGLL